MSNTKPQFIAKHRIEYNTWRGMKDRCYNKNSDAYKYYGKRGIKLCKNWKSSFRNFLSDMGKKPDKLLSIDRKNNNAGYTCGHCDECKKNGYTANCRWTDCEAQNENRRSNRYIDWNGKKITIKQLAKTNKKEYHQFYNRLFLLNWPIEKALRLPTQDRTKLKFRIHGKKLTLHQISQKYGIKWITLYCRIFQYGWTIEKAISTPVAKKNCIIVYKKKLRTLSSIAKEANMDRSVLYHRLFTSKWSIEKSLTTPVKKVNSL